MTGLRFITDLRKINIESIHKKSSVVSGVWDGIIDAWNQFNFNLPNSKDAILKQSLWYNDHIPINKQLYTKKLCSKLPLVEDLIGNDGMFRTQNEILGTNNVKIDSLTLKILRNAIPSPWIKMVQNNIVLPCCSGVEKIERKLKENQGVSITKVIYSYSLVTLNVKRGTQARLKWEGDLDREIMEQSWQQLFTNVTKLTNCTKLRSFQFRLLHRILTTNTDRHKWDKNISSSCCFCNVKEETYSHLFIECKIVKKLWIALKKWLYYHCFIVFEISQYEILMNRYRDCFPALVNTLILIVKQYIYACKCLECTPNFTEIVARIQKYCTIEK